MSKECTYIKLKKIKTEEEAKGIVNDFIGKDISWIQGGSKSVIGKFIEMHWLGKEKEENLCKPKNFKQETKIELLSFSGNLIEPNILNAFTDPKDPDVVYVKQKDYEELL